QADLVPETKRSPAAQFVRITNLGKNQILSLAEVQVFRGDVNVALQGTATQHSTAYGGPAQYAIDGNTDGVFANKSVTHTATVENPWWELDLGDQQSVDKIVLWNRKEASTRLSNFTVELLDDQRQTVMMRHIDAHPDPSLALSTDSKRSIAFKTAFADFEQVDFEAIDVLAGKDGPKDGWAVGGSAHLLHQLVLIPEQPLVVDEPARLRIRLQQDSPHINHLLGHFRFSATADSVAIERSRVPVEILKLVDTPADQRSPEANSELAIHYREQVAPALQAEREGLAKAEAELAALKPATSVPVLREKTGPPRETFLQHRGNYLDKGQLVKAGLPSVFPQPSGDRPLDRLVLADWLTSAENPLTARVLANRYWEILFGKGIVTTSEEFGSQGEMPTHPQLLDWLAVELIESGWDTKQLLKTLVTSATYRQSAVADAVKLAQDPANRWLARAPRVRLSAEMVRDQALSVSGLLSRKMFGPPVKPPQPSFQLKAAFGSSTDWQTSVGEDRYRRGIYTTWRRSNPYPSMATFDAPNREVCTVRRNSTNTPLQSLVTLNDPAYVEAAQSLARQALQHSSSDGERLVFAFRRCLLRPPTDNEITALTALLKDSREDLARHREEALKLATDPLGALPENVDAVDAAAMTVVCNVLLNLDEIFLKR
ncbi:MAG: DUF1553 domain-containing protein, partial [Planctomycetaceae bacterium]|nr:DUF1553 domain-containing protein [Planctomycetaceae bacterium]